MSWFAYIFLLFGLSWSFVGMYRWHLISKGLFDHPNARSSHFLPTARGGGAIFSLGWMLLIGVLHYYNYITLKTLMLFAPALLIAVVGLIEDRKGVSAKTRFITHCVAATACLFMLGEGGNLIFDQLPFFLPLPLCFVLLIFTLVWMTNLYNFMDGSDGMAATQGIFVFAVGGFFIYQYNATEALELATLAFGLVALIAGFLVWNWPMSRIFMGDSGSCFLGFTIAIFALASYKLLNMPILLWVILSALFIFDATVTLLRRIIAKEKWREPHRKHAYQRLIQLGWSHHHVLMGAIATNAVLAGLATLAYYDPRLMPFSLGVSFAFLTSLYIIIEIAKPMQKMWYQT